MENVPTPRFWKWEVLYLQIERQTNLFTEYPLLQTIAGIILMLIALDIVRVWWQSYSATEK